MKIKDSQNLKCDSCPTDHFDGLEKINPQKCILSSFHSTQEAVELYFQNGSAAVLRARNAQGIQEILAIGKMLQGAIRKSYRDILEMNF